MKKRIIILGANGQLGTDLRLIFAEDSNLEVVPVYRSDLDVTDTGAIAPFLQGLGAFDVLLNCTSYHKTDECEEQAAKAFAVNSLAPWEMAKYCAGAQCILLHFTTDYVFDGKKTEPYTENDPACGINIYGISKAAGEQLIKAYCEQSYIFRVSSLFGFAGASGKGGNFVETMIRFAREEKAISVVEDQFMSPTHTLDIARAVHAILRVGGHPYGIYHCSGQGSCSWYEFAEEIFKQMGIDANLTAVKSGPVPVNKAKRPAYSVLDNHKLDAIYKMPPWKVALQEYIQLKHKS